MGLQLVPSPTTSVCRAASAKARLGAGLAPAASGRERGAVGSVGQAHHQSAGRTTGPNSGSPPLPPQFLREEYFKGQYCSVWQDMSNWGKKKNIYTLWVTNTSCGWSPVHYEMRGYNSVLGSHYDKYEIDYSDFTHSYPASAFNLPTNGKMGLAGPLHPWASIYPCPRQASPSSLHSNSTQPGPFALGAAPRCAQRPAWP